MYQSLSRKGFGLGTWDELGKLPSRPDFSYSRKKKKKILGPFLSDHFWFLTSVPGMEMSGFEKDGRDSSAILVS